MNEINEDDTESIERIETPKKKINKNGYQTTSVAKRGFLKLLVRCRRVILQDAAIRLHKGSTSSALNNPIFESLQFKKFQAHVVQEMDSLEDNRLQDFENIIPRIADEIRTTRESIGARQDMLQRDNGNQRQNIQEIERRLEFSERML
ncbi:hypothetical protein BGX26_008769, partial [Mortierella sp. AD094]